MAMMGTQLSELREVEWPIPRSSSKPLYARPGLAATGPRPRIMPAIPAFNLEAVGPVSALPGHSNLLGRAWRGRNFKSLVKIHKNLSPGDCERRSRGRLIRIWPLADH